MKPLRCGDVISVIEEINGKRKYNEYSVRRAVRSKRHNPITGKMDDITIVSTTSGIGYTLSDNDWNEEMKCWKWRFYEDDTSDNYGFVSVF